MKAMTAMNNVEKGKLLADLFPEELQGLLDAIVHMHRALTENMEEIKRNWDNGFIPVDTWCRLAEDIKEIIEREKKQLLRSRRFGDQLFDGYYALFTVDCIVKYADKERDGSRFCYMVKALFNFK